MKWVWLLFFVIGAALILIDRSRAQTQLNLGPPLNSYYVFFFNQQNPNDVAPCNVPSVQGVPYPRPFDEALVKGVPTASGDSIWRCLLGSNGTGVWIEIASAP
jgi:hypothetical protein